MKKYWLWIGILGTLLCCGMAKAAESDSAITSINFLSSYNSYGSGDVIFRVANPTADCVGYWITKTDQGYSANLAMILAAYQAKTPIAVEAINDQLWSGSSSAYCKLIAIQYH